MKALTIRQPFAWLIIHAGKDVENRNWRTAYRGLFWIHAGKAQSGLEYDEARRFYEERVIPRLDPSSSPPELPSMGDLDYGGIIGTARLIDCVEESPSPWFTGPHGFVLRNAKAVPFRPIRGRMGWFEADQKIAA